VTPTDEIACKRLLITDDWYPVLTKANVELVTDPIAKVTSAGIRTEEGTKRPAEVLVLATGFDVHVRLAPLEVVGVGGRTLAEEWAYLARAYLGQGVPGFPNMFILFGPNIGGGSGSVLYTIEAGMAHVIAALEELERADARPPMPSTASCGPLWRGPSGIAAARATNWTRTATTRVFGLGTGARTAEGPPAYSLGAPRRELEPVA
jgi:cation diffusion facilitator CzcD-associated flavoprotein CzcO